MVEPEWRRVVLAAMKLKRISLRCNASAWGCSPSTLSRELAHKCSDCPYMCLDGKRGAPLILKGLYGLWVAHVLGWLSSPQQHTQRDAMPFAPVLSGTKTLTLRLTADRSNSLRMGSGGRSGQWSARICSRFRRQRSISHPDTKDSDPPDAANRAHTQPIEPQSSLAHPLLFSTSSRFFSPTSRFSLSVRDIHTTPACIACWSAW